MLLTILSAGVYTEGESVYYYYCYTYLCCVNIAGDSFNCYTTAKMRVYTEPKGCRVIVTVKGYIIIIHIASGSIRRRICISVHYNMYITFSTIDVRTDFLRVLTSLGYI